MARLCRWYSTAFSYLPTLSISKPKLLYTLDRYRVSLYFLCISSAFKKYSSASGYEPFLRFNTPRLLYETAINS